MFIKKSTCFKYLIFKDSSNSNLPGSVSFCTK